MRWHVCVSERVPVVAFDLVSVLGQALDELVIIVVEFSEVTGRTTLHLTREDLRDFNLSLCLLGPSLFDRCGDSAQHSHEGEQVDHHVSQASGGELFANDALAVFTKDSVRHCGQVAGEIFHGLCLWT